MERGQDTRGYSRVVVGCTNLTLSYGGLGCERVKRKSLHLCAFFLRQSCWFYSFTYNYQPLHPLSQPQASTWIMSRNYMGLEECSRTCLTDKSFQDTWHLRQLTQKGMQFLLQMRKARCLLANVCFQGKYLFTATLSYPLQTHFFF